jgi:threonine synthase
LKVYTGLDRLYLKNETANPTWSFKDRGTVVCCALARQLGEPYLATISTGNMGQSVAAYAARCGLKALIVVPATASPQKLQAAAVYGATILRVETDDLCNLKHQLAAVAKSLGLRITSGANPFRVEGYKFEAFEMWEQLDGVVPDFVIVPTSAGGHIRGIFKGWQELEAAGLVESLPTMVLVQAASNAPLADALVGELPEPVPYPPAKTYASALTSNDPPGGADLLRLAQNAGWLGATVAEEAICEGWEIAARAGLWVEPSSAIVLPALRQLAARGVIPRDACVVASVTGAGPKDMRLVENSSFTVVQTTLTALENQLKKFLSEL